MAGYGDFESFLLEDGIAGRQPHSNSVYSVRHSGISSLGLTCGLASRDFWRGFSGLIISAASGAVFFLFTVDSSRTILLSPDQGLFPSGDTAHYIGPLLGACIGAVIALPQQGLVWFACLLVLISTINLICAAYAIMHLFPGNLLGVRVWEYATLLAAVPIMGAGIWGPLDLIRKKQFEHCDTASDYLVALKKSF